MPQRLQPTNSKQLHGEFSFAVPVAPPVQHERLTDAFTSLRDEQIETSFAKMERTDLARYHNGHHPVLRRWQHLLRISENAVCRLRGEVVESAENTCPVIMADRQHSYLGYPIVELVRLPREILALQGSSTGACGNIYNRIS